MVDAPPGSETPELTEGESSSSRYANRRIAVWAVVTLALAGALTLLSISTVSYTYSPFMQRTYREVGHHGFVSVWKTQVEDLSSISSQWLLDAMFVAAIVVLLVGVVVGMWLLLVGSGDQMARDRRYHLPGHQTE